MAKKNKQTKKQSKQMTQKELYKYLASDFRNFLYMIWKYLHLPAPTKRQYEVAYYLQHSQSKRRIIEAYRGFGKSWITSAYALWKLYRNPNEKILVISASGDRAKMFTTFCQRLIMDIPFLKPLIPPAWMRWSSTAFDVNGALASHAPSIKAAGVFSQITGSRATEIILDDVETINTVETDVMRAKLINVLSEMENIVVPGGVITYLGTPHSVDSIYGEHKLLARGYEAYIIPARYPKLEDLEWYGDRLSPHIRKELEEDPSLEWQPTDPERFDDETLRLKEVGAGKSNFMMQFMLNTSLNDDLKYPLKISDLIIFETDPMKAPASIRHTNDPEFKLDIPGLGVSGRDHAYKPMRVDTTWLPYKGIFMGIDPSGRGSDQTTYAIIGQLHGNLYLLDLGGFQGGYTPETLTKLAQKAKEYNVNKIFVESNFGEGTFTELLKPILYKIHKADLEEVRQYKQKEKRIIDTLEPVMNQHRLIVDRDVFNREYVLYSDGVNQFYSLIYQLTMLTDEKDCLKHDDKVDVLAITVQAWRDALGLDEETLLKQYKQEQFEAILNDFQNSFLGLGVPLVEQYSDERDWFKDNF